MFDSQPLLFWSNHFAYRLSTVLWGWKLQNRRDRSCGLCPIFIPKRDKRNAKCMCWHFSFTKKWIWSAQLRKYPFEPLFSSRRWIKPLRPVCTFSLNRHMAYWWRFRRTRVLLFPSMSSQRGEQAERPQTPAPWLNACQPQPDNQPWNTQAEQANGNSLIPTGPSDQNTAPKPLPGIIVVKCSAYSSSLLFVCQTLNSNCRQNRRMKLKKNASETYKYQNKVIDTTHHTTKYYVCKSNRS